jgi:PKD repeat protein
MKKITLTILAFAAFLLMSLNACFLFSQETSENNTETTIKAESVIQNEENKNETGLEIEKIQAEAFFEIFQPGSSGGNFFTNNPVFFIASESIGLEDLKYQWRINEQIVSSGQKTSYIFKKAGIYPIALEVFDGQASDKRIIEINVIDLKTNIINTRSHDVLVEITYFIKNQGPSKINNMEVRIDTPQTNFPFQEIRKTTLNHDVYTQDFDSNYNLITMFEFNEMENGEQTVVSMLIDATLYEFDFIEPDPGADAYDAGDMDLITYTQSGHYIDSDDFEIKKIANEITEGITDPYHISKALYDYVIEKLEYDFKRLDENDYKFLKASEILKLNEGICTDYSILYAALLRAKGIPAKVVLGIPVFAIVAENEGYLEVGHAWVEAKLPYYGWVPLDITNESAFMSYNYFLNLKTFEGIDGFYDSENPEYPIGIFYRYSDGTAQIEKEIKYKVSGLEKKELMVLEERDFLNSLYSVINDYTMAINHVSSLRTESWIFNDPDQIALEESLLHKFKEIETKLSFADYPVSYEIDVQNVRTIASYIGFYKEEQVSNMKNNQFEESLENNAKCVENLNLLIDYYNKMLKIYNEKYN